MRRATFPAGCASSRSIPLATPSSSSRFAQTANEDVRFASALLGDRGQELVEGQRVDHVGWLEPGPAGLGNAPFEVLELVAVVSIRVDGEAAAGVVGGSRPAVVQVQPLIG